MGTGTLVDAIVGAGVGSGLGVTTTVSGVVGSGVGVTEARLTLRWVTVADDACPIPPARSLTAGGGAPRLTGATPSNPGSVSGLADISELSALGRGSTVSPAQAVTINDKHKRANSIPRHTGSHKRGKCRRTLGRGGTVGVVGRKYAIGTGVVNLGQRPMIPETRTKTGFPGWMLSYPG